MRDASQPSHRDHLGRSGGRRTVDDAVLLVDERASCAKAQEIGRDVPPTRTARRLRSGRTEGWAGPLRVESRAFRQPTSLNAAYPR
jgi:hypothetical protein